MSGTILGRIDELGAQLDALERAVGDLAVAVRALRLEQCAGRPLTQRARPRLRRTARLRTLRRRGSAARHARAARPRRNTHTRARATRTTVSQHAIIRSAHCRRERSKIWRMLPLVMSQSRKCDCMAACSSRRRASSSAASRTAVCSSPTRRTLASVASA